MLLGNLPMFRSKYTFTTTNAAVILIIAASFFWRLWGIQSNVSFWSDEALIASFARDILQGKSSLQEALSIYGSSYQPLNVITFFASFALFGPSEFAARLPSVIWGTVAVGATWLITKKRSTVEAAFFSSTISAFFFLNLAHSTQAKPYIALQALLLLSAYWAEKRQGKTLMASILCAALATGYHATGALIFVFPLWGILQWEKEHWKKSPKVHISTVIAILALGVVGALNIPTLTSIFLSLCPGTALVCQNNTAHLKLLFFTHYSWLTLPALLGLSWKSFKDKWKFIADWAYLIAIIFLWTFILYSKNLRYLIPVFGILISWSGIFWSKIAETLFGKWKKVALIGILAILLIGTGAFSLKPQKYYSPNHVFHGDVQNADYKRAFEWIRNNYPQEEAVILNNVIDAQKWYFTRPANAYFSISATQEPQYLDIVDRWSYSRLDDFTNFVKSHPQGIIIVEDWTSYLPEEIKTYVKENFHEEFRKDCLPESPTDCWPLAVYSWGQK